AQGVAALAYRQVGGQQLDIRRGLQGELPEPLVVAPQATGASGEEFVQRSRILFLLQQPGGQVVGLLQPGTGGQRVAQRQLPAIEQGGGEQGPGQVAYPWLAQARQQAFEGRSHRPSIADAVCCGSRL